MYDYEVEIVFCFKLALHFTDLIIVPCIHGILKHISLCYIDSKQISFF